MKTYSFLLVLAFLLTVTVSKVSAQAFNINDPILVTVDISDPSAVTFTATTNDPNIANSNHLFSDGVDFTRFFYPHELGSFSDSFTFSVTGTGLTTFNQGTPVYDSARSDYLSEGVWDINLYTAGSSASETFTPATQAFTGTLTLDLSAYAAFFPALGTVNTIYAGNVHSANSVQYIGGYQIVPEPSQWSLLLLGAVGLMIAHRFRASRA